VSGRITSVRHSLTFTPTKTVHANFFSAIDFKRLTECIQLGSGSSSSGKDCLDICFVLVSLWWELLHWESCVRLEEVGHVDCRLQARCNYVCSLLGLREVTACEGAHLRIIDNARLLIDPPEDIIDADNCVFAAIRASDIDLFEVAIRLEGAFGGIFIGIHGGNVAACFVRVVYGCGHLCFVQVVN